MLSALFGAIGACVIVVSGLLYRYSRLAALVGVCIAYDNAVIAVGRLVGEGDLLRQLSLGRFVAHALLTPVMILVAASAATRLGVSSFGKRGLRVGLGLFALALVAVGFLLDVIRLDLGVKIYADTVRYPNIATHGPPPAPILTIVTLLVIGAVIWRRAKVAWLFLGALAMFATAAAGPQLFWLSNIGELALLTGFWLTFRRIPEEQRAWRKPAMSRAQS